MREAVNAINEQGMSVSKASVLYGIPRTTLNDHKLGKVLPGAKPGAPTLLSTSEEDDLVDFLIKFADIGYGRTRKEVLGIVSRMQACRGVDRGVTSGWWNKFLCRHPILSVRTPATLSVARARASNRETIDSYFDILEETLQETGLIDYPALYFNMDESGFALDPKSMKTIHICGEKKPLSISSGSKSQVTAIACVSATGQAIPPLIIWKRKTMTAEMAVGEIPGTQYGFSENGWTNSILFDSWFKKQFMRYAPASRPLILFLDGHSSHYCPDTINLAADNGIIIFTLPPNTTHLTQPLDKGVFGPFKQHWRRVCHDFKISHQGQVINDYNFCRLFSKVWIESMTTSNIIGGFHTTGIYPINRNAIQLPGESKLTDKLIAPCLNFTPFKRHPVEDGLHSSSDILTAQHSPLLASKSKRPNSLTDIVHTNTPVIKSQRISAPADRVLTSLAFKNNRKGTKTSELQTNSFAKEGSKKSVKCKLPPQLCICIHFDFHVTAIFHIASVAYIQCFVCKEKTVVTFKPCGHSVLCDVCAERVKKCPTCKVTS